MRFMKCTVIKSASPSSHLNTSTLRFVIRVAFVNKQFHRFVFVQDGNCFLLLAVFALCISFSASFSLLTLQQ